MKKIVFIDTNVFIDCVYKMTDNLDCKPLEEILKKLEINELILILPEITEKEILEILSSKSNELKKKIDNSFNQVEKNVEHEMKKDEGKVSRIIKDLIQQGKEKCTDGVQKEIEKGVKITKNIINHNNVKKVEMTDYLMLKGMRRSLFKVAPFEANNKKKGVHTKDQDCIAFESILSFLKEGDYKGYTFIVCAADADYFDGKEEGENLGEEIVKDLKKFCKEVRGYRNPLKMLNEEFSSNYSKEYIEEYTESVSSIPLSSKELSLPYINEDKSVSALSGHLCHGGVSGMSFSPGEITGQEEAPKKYCRYCGNETTLSKYNYCVCCSTHLG